MLPILQQLAENMGGSFFFKLFSSNMREWPFSELYTMAVFSIPLVICIFMEYVELVWGLGLSCVELRHLVTMVPPLYAAQSEPLN